MKSSVLLFLLLVSFLFFYGCKTAVTCPPDKKIGTKPFSTAIKPLIPYKQNQKQIFINSNGEEIELDVLRTESGMKDRLCVKKICSTIDIKSKTTCEYLAGEVSRFFISGEKNGKTVSGDILFYHYQLEPYSQSFAVAMRMSMEHETRQSMGGIILENESGVNPNAQFLKSELGNIFEEKSNIELNGQTFTDVYIQTAAQPKFYLSKSKGLIGFEMNGELWVVKVS